MSQESVYIASVDEPTGTRKESLRRRLSLRVPVRRVCVADSPYKSPKHPNYIQHEPYSERIG